MRVEYINPFVEATQSVLIESLQVPVERGKLFLKKSNVAIMGVAAIVGLVGDVEGRIIFDMSIQTAVNLASIMMKNMGMDPVTELDDLAKSSITELANMITGQAVTKLSDLGFTFDLTPPALFTGEKMTVMDDKSECLIVPIKIVGYGDIEVNLAIRERM